MRTGSASSLPDGAVTQGATVGQVDALAIGGVARRRAVLRLSRRVWQPKAPSA
jgi:hypothetical protein